MRPDEFNALLLQRPFRKLRLYVTGGETFDVRHPEAAIVGRSTVSLERPTDENAGATAVISLLHIVWVEVS